MQKFKDIILVVCGFVNAFYCQIVIFEISRYSVSAFCEQMLECTWHHIIMVLDVFWLSLSCYLPLFSPLFFSLSFSLSRLSQQARNQADAKSWCRSLETAKTNDVKTNTVTLNSFAKRYPYVIEYVYLFIALHTLHTHVTWNGHIFSLPI